MKLDFHRLDLERLLDKLNIVYEVNHDEIRASCPLPEHDDSTPSWFMNADKNSSMYGRWHCFGCQEKGDPATLVSQVLKLTRGSALLFLQKEFDIRKEGGDIYSNVMTRFVRRLTKQVEDAPDLARYFMEMEILEGIENEFSEYLYERNVTRDEISKFEMQFCRNGYFKNRVVIPVYTEGQLRTLWGRDITGDAKSKILYPKGKRTMSRALFNYDIASESKTVWVVEGIFDALRLYREGYINVVAMLSSTCSDYQADLLSKFPSVIMIPDGDNGGQTLTVSLISKLKFSSELFIVGLPQDEDPDSCSDLFERMQEPKSLWNRKIEHSLSVNYDTMRRG